MDIFEKWDRFIKRSDNTDSLKKQREFVLYTLGNMIKDNSVESVVHGMDEKTLNQLANILRKAYLDHEKSSDWGTPR